MQGGRDGRVLVGDVAVAPGTRRGLEEDDGRSAHEAREQSDAVRRQAAHLRRIRNDRRGVTPIRLFLLFEAATFIVASLVHAGFLISGYEHARARIAEGV